MHIDHSKLVELLVETSGIEKDKIETQLTELVDEIREAISEGEAYEVDGLGIFSGIGNNMIFMPSEDLATEINYKYVGMEAIKIDDAPEKPKPSKEKKVKEDDDDPFAGLLGDDEDEPQESDSSFELDEPDEEEPKLSEKKIH
ncbi:MAG TPA: HU family DNA-binding protein [Gracilimonas sp.]|uniref:HU family DNA-binding protein n=1 Tax=Gracilimonas sp. TaxID=1974203 RepID=UPI002D8343B9|nr:HU family DNA-binding protein [Gracilimonas sp.]